MIKINNNAYLFGGKSHSYILSTSFRIDEKGKKHPYGKIMHFSELKSILYRLVDMAMHEGIEEGLWEAVGEKIEAVHRRIEEIGDLVKPKRPYQGP